jgi:hypothetical protein
MESSLTVMLHENITIYSLHAVAPMNPLQHFSFFCSNVVSLDSRSMNLKCLLVLTIVSPVLNSRLFVNLGGMSTEQLYDELEFAEADLELNIKHRADSQARLNLAEELRDFVPRIKASYMRTIAGDSGRLVEYIETVTCIDDKSETLTQGYRLIIDSINSGVPYSVIRERLKKVASQNDRAGRRVSRIIHRLRERVKHIEQLTSKDTDISDGIDLE